jgi:hypothetical protein
MIHKLKLLCFTLLAAASVQAQNFTKNVPTNAIVVGRLNAGSFSKALPTAKLMEYEFYTKNIAPLFSEEGLDIEKIGVDLTKEAVFYLSTEDTTRIFSFMLPINNKAAFEKFFTSKMEYKQFKITQQNGYTIYTSTDDGDGVTIALNNTQAIIINATYLNKKYYWQQYNDYGTPTATITEVAADTTMVTYTPPAITMVDAAPPAKIEEATISNDVIMAPPPPPPYKGSQQKKKKVATKKPIAKKVTLTPAQKKAAAAAEAARRKREREEREAELEKERQEEIARTNFEKVQNAIAKKAQDAVTAKVITAFTGNGLPNNVTQNISYIKTVDATSDVNVYYNTAGIFGLVYGTNSGISNYGNSTINNLNNLLYSNPAFSKLGATVNVNFKEKELEVVTKGYSDDEAFRKLMDATYAKHSGKLAGIANADNVAYLSTNVNVKALFDMYYSIGRSVATNKTNEEFAKYGDVADIVIDLIETAVDEQAIADLLPTNMVAVVHNIAPEKVTYVDYEYDNEYNRKEITKEKVELRPSFSFAFETKTDRFYKKLLSLPTKHKEIFAGENLEYANLGNYFLLTIKEANVLAQKLYFAVNNGTAIVTTNKSVLDNFLAGKLVSNSEILKNTTDNNTYFKVDLEKLAKTFATEIGDEEAKRYLDYLKNNVGILESKSNIEGDVYQTKTRITVNGKHSNSVTYIFDLIENLANLSKETSPEVKEQ